MPSILSTSSFSGGVPSSGAMVSFAEPKPEYSTKSDTSAPAQPSILSEVKRDYVTIKQLSGVPIAMEELYQGPVLAAFKANDAVLHLKSLSSNPAISAKMAQEGLAVALVSAHVAAAVAQEGLVVKQIKGGESLAARYCLLAQQGNYRSQVVNNFLAMLADTLALEIPDVPSDPAKTAEV